MLRIELNKNDGGQRLDKFLTKTLKGIPPSLMYKYIRKKRIKVNGARAKENTILTAGDVIELYIPDEFAKKDTNTSEYDRVQAVPDIVYEDENLISVPNARECFRIQETWEKTVHLPYLSGTRLFL